MARRAVLFANGELPDSKLIPPLLQPTDYLIAVDGGLRHLRDLQKTPDLLIGDLDSVSADEVETVKSQGAEVRRYKVDKDETDLELALLAAVEMGFQEILVIAALGGRLDHTLANLQLLAMPELAEASVVLADGLEEVFIIRNTAQLSGKRGDVVSLIPLFGRVTGVETRELKYPLNNETLLPEKSRGISNVMLSDQVEISIGSGLLLCIHSRNRVEEK